MKTLQKKSIVKVGSTIFIERKQELKFPDGYVPFVEKTARAKETLSKMSLPVSFKSK